MKKAQSGFTMIELVMVIVILGILGAVAIPKFMDVSTDAQTAATAATTGAKAEAKNAYDLCMLTPGHSVDKCGTGALQVDKP